MIGFKNETKKHKPMLKEDPPPPLVLLLLVLLKDFGVNWKDDEEEDEF